MIVVLSGPGGVGKGTIVRALVQVDPKLWLSRSWTTRHQRHGEADDAYVFASREQFERRRDEGGFLEWTEFLGNLYGTPVPESRAGRDVLLEIEVDGARQVRRVHPEALCLFVLPPSRQEQERRLRERGDPEEKVRQRLAKASDEEPVGRAMADHVVVNDDLATTVAEIAALIDRARSSGAHEHSGERVNGAPAPAAAPAQSVSDLLESASPPATTGALSMARVHDSMIYPPVEDLLDRVDSKFTLVTLAAKRARQINSYFNHLGDGLGSMVPPQVASLSRKPLTISFEEVAADKIGYERTVLADDSDSDDGLAVEGDAGA